MSDSARSILKELEGKGSEGYRKILRSHGADIPMFGVKIADLKKIQKRVKRNHGLALELFDTGNYDAMYLAGLIADDEKMSKQNLRKWMSGAKCPTIAEFTVAWVTAQGKYGWDMALDWIDSKKEIEAAGGWSTLGCLVALIADTDLDLARLKKLLNRVSERIHSERNRVRYAMNGFLISLGSHVAAMHEEALVAAKKIDSVTVDMGGTACKVPHAETYIKRVEARGSLGKKRKSVKC
jgi:3-methyladenine DNA glycosylase AlkD